MSPPAELRVRACGLSDVGMSRSHNEDSFQVDSEHRLFVVADGMGGHRHGEVASRLAIETISSSIADGGARDLERFAGSYPESKRLAAAIQAAHHRVLEAIGEDITLVGMGTTVVGALLTGRLAAVAHVGDSRAYRLRHGELEQLTRDHTWVYEQLRAGLLSEQEARVHPLRNVVTRALGGSSQVQIDVIEVELQPGDLLLLCSDGLTAMLEDGEIQTLLAAAGSLEQACEELVRVANERGGLDNITVVLVGVEEEEGLEA